MAAGIGSRFGGALSSLSLWIPEAIFIMEYSIYDAKEAEFDKVIFVIRKDLLAEKKVKEKIEVEYAFQEIADVPERYRGLAADWKKPWGTGQAILACKDLIGSPFLGINADDY